MKKDIFIVPKTGSDYKKWKTWNILSLQVSNLAPKMVAGVRHGNSLVVRRVSPGRIIFVLFWTKCFVPRPIKPRILKLSFRRGQGNFSIVFTFSSREETGNFPVSEGQLFFDCQSYCGLGRRMQTPFYGLYRHLRPQKHFAHKWGIYFYHFGLK